MRRILVFAVLLLGSQAFAGRAATYVATKGGVSQTLVVRRETAQTISFRFVSECAKARCTDSLVGEAVSDPFKKPVKGGSKGDFAAEEYVYRKGKCQVVFRVDMESASMVKVLASCPEHNKKKCPLEIDETLRIRR